MKKIISILAVLAIVGLFGFTLFFLYSKSQAEPTHYDTETARRMDIVRKTVATGAIVPRQEIEIKPRVSGILETLSVEAGQHVKQGDLIGTIEIVPDTARLAQAQAAVKQAKITMTNAQNELDRAKKLRSQGIMASAQFSSYELAFQLAEQTLAAAQDNLQVIRKGASRSSGKTVNTEIRSTVSGMVLDVPVETGTTLTESNNFNAGTTVAIVADMGDMIFEGKVDESEVGKIKEGMPLVIRIGALEGVTFDGKLEYISPKGATEDGAIQFEIKAAITPVEGQFIRAGYSANADIVLEKADGVLAINESVLQFDEQKKPYVEVEIGPQRFERRDVELGLSDGIFIEVKSGITEADKVKGRKAGAGGGKRRGPPRRR